jgi:catechol 2,3-dioxygenase-like lactoylglutathione lyase family enzyme
MITAAPRHYGIVVSDLERALGFYRDLLDLKVARQMDETGPFIETVLGMPGVDVTTCKMEAEKGGTQVELLCFKSHKDPSPRPPHGRMAANGVQFVSPPQVSADGNAKVAFCRDPDGTLLELVELIRRQDSL